MQYFYPNKLLPNFWYSVLQMVEENYSSQEHDNDVLLLGCYIHQGVNAIKREINPEGFYKKIIAYQLEPLVANHWWKTEKIIEKLQGADEVWDYDLDNIEILKNYGIDAKFRPFQYTHSLKKIPDNIEKTIDVLFYGTFTEYRFQTVKNMIYYPTPVVDAIDRLKFVWLYNIDDVNLDEYIAKSKIILNLNPYDGETRQQQSRIFYPLINNKCIVSQKSVRNYFGDSIHEFTDKFELKEKLEHLLQNEGWKNTDNITWGQR